MPLFEKEKNYILTLLTLIIWSHQVFVFCSKICKEIINFGLYLCFADIS
jgi:hypothetical protein